MTTEPSRSPPVLAAIVTVTVALPFADAGSTAIHPASEAALHVQAGEVAVTLTFMWPPTAGASPFDGVTVNAHGAGSCVTSIDALLTVSVPRRVDGSTLGATRNAIVPSPCPLPPEVIDSHGALLAAVHVHSRFVVTVAVPAPPAYGAEVIDVDTDAAHLSPLGATVEIDAEPHAAAAHAAAKIPTR
jgi:hypothetical protein